MMTSLPVLMVMATTSLVQCQRPFFAGSKPIGYPEIATTEGLGDRFGEVDGTTQRLPIEANGDRELVDRLSKLPIDKQPFWLINWQALEANREKPQTYPQRPNVFIDAQNLGNSNSANTGSANSGVANSGSSSAPASSNRSPTIANRISENATPNPVSANRNSVSSNSVTTSTASSFSTVVSSQNVASVPIVSDRHGGIEPNNFDAKYHTIYSNVGSGSANSKP